MALTAKQQRFVAEYLIDLNASGAARRAGYSARTSDQLGYQLLQIPSVREAIRVAQERKAAETELSAAWVLGRLRQEADDRGEGATHSARVRALELLGKHVGMWQETAPAPVHVNVTLMSDADLLTLAAQGLPERNGHHPG